MNPNAIYREIGLLDEALITAAEKEKHSRPHLRHWMSMAACLALVVAVAGIWQSGLLTPAPNTPDGIPSINNPAIAGDEGDRYALTLNHATTAMAARRVIEGHFWQTLTAAELGAVFPAKAEREGSYTVTATANFSTTETGTHLVDVVSEFVSGEGTTAQVTASPEEIIKCYLMDGEPMLSEIGGVFIDAGYFDDTNDGSVLYYADFTLDDVHYYVEMKGGKAEQATLAALLDHLIAGGKADFTAIASNPPPLMRDEKLTMAQARADEVFGAFIPQRFPDGYTLNGATRFVNQQWDTLSVSLSHGVDDLSWRVSRLGDEDKRHITSVADTQNYDLSLYPIPRADSVPEALWEIVNRPIFHIEELTLDAVKMRAYRIAEVGDSDGWRMHFGVLYGDVLVELTAKGLAPEVVFDLLTEIAPK